MVTSLGLTSANDGPDRDPATFVLSGSNDDGVTFTEIASGDVPAFGERFERQEVTFSNDVAYTTYELIFPTTAGASTCCMQIAEVELIDNSISEEPRDVTNPSDTTLADYALGALLESQGHNVLYQGPNYEMNGIDPRHYSFVVISSSLKDDTWAEKYAGTTAPVINLDGSAQYALGFIGTRDELAGTISTASQIVIVDADHPLAGGVAAGAQTILSSAGTLNWGTPSASAVIIATAGSASHQAGVYGYDTGSSMAGGIEAAGRRVNLAIQTADLGNMTAEGGALLVAAVNWVSSFSIIDVGGDVEATVGDSTVLNGRVSGENITIQWYKNDAAIEGATSVSLDLGSVQAGNSGTYKMIATDATALAKDRYKEISYVVKVSARGDEVVLVTGVDALSASDSAIKGILSSKGYDVVTATAANTSSATLDGRLMVVVSPSVTTAGATIYENTATVGAYFASVKEFGDEVKLGLNNRLLDSLSFEYFGDFTAEGDEKAVVRIYANDAGNTTSVSKQPGTMLYESDPFAIAAGFNSVNVSDLLIEVPDTITWTVQFSGVANTEGDRAGLVYNNPVTTGSSFDDFWINSGDVIYNSTQGVYEAYYNTGTEFGDEINLAGSGRSLNEIEFEAYAEITSSPAPRAAVTAVTAVAAVTAVEAVVGVTAVAASAAVEATYYLNAATLPVGKNVGDLKSPAKAAVDEVVAVVEVDKVDAVEAVVGVEAVTALPPPFATLRVYANDGENATANYDSKTPGTLLFTSSPITLSAGLNTYRVSGIKVDLPDTVTWTVEFTGVSGNELNVGNRAALVLGGIDVVGSSLDDFWQKDEAGWATYQTTSVNEGSDFNARLVAQAWRTYRDTDSELIDNFGAKVTAGVDVNFLESASLPVVVVNTGLQTDWGVADGSTFLEGSSLPSGTTVPDRRAFLSSSADAAKVEQAIDWVMESGFTTTPNSSELEAGESFTLSAVGYGPGDITYQWKKDGANIDGKTGANYVLSNVKKDTAGSYSVVITASNGATAEESAEVKVFAMPSIILKSPAAGSTTSAITHQVKIWSLGGGLLKDGWDKIDLATASILINGVDVTANATKKTTIRGIQAIVDLVENGDQNTIPGLFLGYDTLAPGADNAMNVTFSFEPVGGDRVLTRSWTYTLYSAPAIGESDIAKMAVNQIFQRGEDLYVIWPGSPGLILERNSDCRGGAWESIPSTVGKGIHVEKNCGTKAFFRLVRVKE